MRSESPPPFPAPAAPSKLPVGLWGPPHAFAAPRHQGARPCPLGSPDAEARLRWDPGSFALGAERGFLQGKVASPRGPGHPQPSSPQRKDRFPKAQVCLSSRKLAVKLKSISGERRTHTFALTLFQTLSGSVLGTLAFSSVPPT